MKKITISEWKCLYPIKKCILILTEGFFTFFSIMGIFKVGEFEKWINYFVWCVFIVSAIVLLPIAIRYIKVPYRCVPGILSRMGKGIISQAIEAENFQQQEKLKNSIWWHCLLVSKNWICVQNHYIPRNGIIEMWLKCEQGATDRVYYLGFLLLTGEIFQKKVAVIPKASAIDDKEIFTKTETSITQILQENTEGIGFDYSTYFNKKVIREDSKIIKKLQGTLLDDDILEVIFYRNNMQNELIEAVMQRKVQKPIYINEIWKERWKRIPVYRKFIDEKWWKD